MNILLAGGAGYIGSHTIIELDKAGHGVVVVDNLVNCDVLLRLLERASLSMRLTCVIGMHFLRCSMRISLMQ